MHSWLTGFACVLRFKRKGEQNHSGDVSVFLGLGNGTFQALAAYKIATSAVSAAPVFLAAADLNGDGRPDLVTVGRSPDAVAISLGRGYGTFQPPTFLTPGKNAHAAAIGDVNGDGRPDIVVANSGGDLNTDPGSLSVFLSTGGGNFQAAFPARLSGPSEPNARRRRTMH